MSFEQHPEEKRLQAIIADPNASDYDKAHAASQLSHGIWHRNDFAQSLTYGIIAEQYFKKLNDQTNVADSIFRQAAAHFALKAYREALERYESAAAIFRSEVNQIFLARSVERKAACLQELDQPQQSASSYLEAAALFLSNDNDSAAADAYNSAAQQLIAANQNEQAELYATLSLEHYGKGENDINLPAVYETRGIALALQDNHEPAIQDYLAGLSVATYQSSTPEIASLNMCLAESYCWLSRFDEAEFAIDRAKAAFTENMDATGLARADQLLAQIYLKQDRYVEAIQKAQDCRALIKFSDPEQSFVVEWLLARANAKMGEFDAAINGYEVALASFQKLGKAFDTAQEFFIEYAELLLQTPNHAAALAVLDNVEFIDKLTKLERIRYQVARARAHRLLGHIEQSLELVNIGLDLIRDDTAHPLLADLLEIKARALCDRGELAEGLPAMQNAINAHLISGSAESARYLALELRNLSNPKQDSGDQGSASDLTLWGDDNQAA